MYFSLPPSPPENRWLPQSGLKNINNRFISALLILLLSGCSLPLEPTGFRSQGEIRSAPFYPQIRQVQAQDTQADTELMPYRVNGIVYYPLESASGYDRKGIASWYGPKFHGKQTSNQETYDMHSMTAAHKILPFNTRVRVTNLNTGSSVVVRINDRGPFVGRRIIDLSYRAGVELGMVENGTVPVRVQALPPVTSASGTAEPVLPRTPESFAVQVGVFKDRDNAVRLAGQLGDGAVLDFNQSGEILYRVVTTAYNTFDQAQERMDRLRREGRSGAFVIPAPRP